MWQDRGDSCGIAAKMSIRRSGISITSEYFRCKIRERPLRSFPFFLETKGTLFCRRFTARCPGSQFGKGCTIFPVFSRNKRKSYLYNAMAFTARLRRTVNTHCLNHFCSRIAVRDFALCAKYRKNNARLSFYSNAPVLRKNPVGNDVINQKPLKP